MGITRSLSISKGEGVRVCLVDTGVDAKHPDLAGVNFVDGTDLTSQGAPNGLKPLNDHGTGMAVNIAGSNANGLLGAAPKSSIISVSIPGHFEEKLHDESFYDAAVEYCVDHGARVINISKSGGYIRKYKAIQHAQEKDVVVVGGAGNDGVRNGISWRANFGMLAVAGVDQDFQLDPQSNFSEAETNPAGKVQYMGVAVCGPYATSAKPRIGVPMAIPGGGYKQTSGTSIATSVVSGVVAAVRAKYPQMDAANVVNRVLKTAKKSGEGVVPTPQCGWGVVDAYAALTADVPPVAANPLGQLGGDCVDDARGVKGVRSMGEWDPEFKPTCSATGLNAEPAGILNDKRVWIGGGLGTAAVIGVVLAVIFGRRRRHG
nr:S8 family serine peptidase [Austwickia sp. TVS 96-490-7B]